MRRTPLVERIAERQARDRARAAELCGHVPGFARRLRELGATRVRLFGSLATGTPPHADTDIDLCVEGLDEGAAADALLELESIARARVDLVRWEAAGPRLRARVESDGIEVGT